MIAEYMFALSARRVYPLGTQQIDSNAAVLSTREREEKRKEERIQHEEKMERKKKAGGRGMSRRKMFDLFV